MLTDRARGLYEAIDKPLVPVLNSMERRGVLIDVPWLQRWERELAIRLVDQHAAFHEAAGLGAMSEAGLIGGINPASPDQVSWLLFTHLGLPPQAYTSKGYATDEPTLRALWDQHPVVPALFEYRATNKLLGTYARGMQEGVLRFGDGRLHGQFKGAGTKTGRLASAGPNMQNIPLVARRAVISPPGHLLVSADYSQIELRIAASVSGDPALCDDFRRGESPHLRTMQAVFGTRDKAAEPKKYTLSKNINFGTFYGAGPDRLQEQAREGGIYEPRETFVRMHAIHRKTYPTLHEWIAATIEQAHRDGYVETLQGRRMYYPDLEHPNPEVRAEAERQAVNAIIQGTAGYFTKAAMVEWGKPDMLMSYQSDWPLVLQVHDELVLEAPASESASALYDLRGIMLGAAQPWLSVPVEVEGKIGPHWAALK